MCGALYHDAITPAEMFAGDFPLPSWLKFAPYFEIRVDSAAVERPVKPVHVVLPCGVDFVDARLCVRAVFVFNLHIRRPRRTGVGGKFCLLERAHGVAVESVVLVEPVDGLRHEVVARGEAAELECQVPVGEEIPVVGGEERLQVQRLRAVVLLYVERIADSVFCNAVAETPRPRVADCPAAERLYARELAQVYAQAEIHRACVARPGATFPPTRSRRSCPNTRRSEQSRCFRRSVARRTCWPARGARRTTPER